MKDEGRKDEEKTNKQCGSVSAEFPNILMELQTGLSKQISEISSTLPGKQKKNNHTVLRCKHLNKL